MCRGKDLEDRKPNQDSIPHIKRFVAVETERSEGQYFMFWLYFANLQV